MIAISFLKTYKAKVLFNRNYLVSKIADFKYHHFSQIDNTRMVKNNTNISVEERFALVIEQIFCIFISPKVNKKIN